MGVDLARFGYGEGHNTNRPSQHIGASGRPNAGDLPRVAREVRYGRRLLRHQPAKPQRISRALLSLSVAFPNQTSPSEHQGIDAKNTRGWGTPQTND